MIFAVAGAVLSGAAAAWLAQTFAANAAERRVVERERRDRLRTRLEATRADQIACFEEYLRVSSSLLGSSSDTDRIERRYFTEASRLAAAERLADRRAAPLYARAFRLFTAEIAGDVVRALRQAATGRYRLDQEAAERSARELDQRSQEGMLNAIQNTSRELGDKERRPSSTGAALPARVSLPEARVDFAPPLQVAPNAPAPEGWLRCMTCASNMPPHFDWCAHCGQRKTTPRAARSAEPSALHVGPLSMLPPVLFDNEAVESLLAEQLQETPLPDLSLHFPAPGAVPLNGDGPHTNDNADSQLEPITIEAQEIDSDDERYRSRQPPPPSIPPRWSVVLTNGVSQEMTLEELSDMIHDGRVAPGTLVRKEGMATYADINAFAELAPEPTAAEN